MNNYLVWNVNDPENPFDFVAYDAEDAAKKWAAGEGVGVFTVVVEGPYGVGRYEVCGRQVIDYTVRRI